MTPISEESGWPLAAIHIGAATFIAVMAVSVFFAPAIWVLHVCQSLIYVAIMVFAQRRSLVALGAGFTIAMLWNGGNLFGTGFIGDGFTALRTSLSAGHIVRPVSMLVLVGAAGHLLMIAGCLVAFIRWSTGRREWARFAGGAVLGVLALGLITPLRLRLHEQPIPLDVPPRLDVLRGG